MRKYGEIIEFLAKNPPQRNNKRALHASLLELIATCLRSQNPVLDDRQNANGYGSNFLEPTEAGQIYWINFS